MKTVQVNSPRLIGAQKKKKSRGVAFKRNIFIFSFIAIPVAHFLFFFLYTNANTIVLSFQEYDQINNEYVWVGVKNYRLFFSGYSAPGSVLPAAVRNSLLFSALNNFVILPLSFFAAFFLYKKMPLSNMFRVLFFMPSIISIVVLTMLYSFMFDSSIGIVDTILAKFGLGHYIPEFGWFGDKNTAMPLLLLYCIWAGIGYNVVLLSGAMARVPTEIVESGRLDGLSMAREMFSITLPLIGTTVSTLMMMGITVIFTLFMQPLLITNGGPDGETYTIALYIVTAIRNEGRINTGAAVGVVCAVVGFPLVIITKKILERLFPAYEY